jgi:hypothetical protein
LKNLIKKKLKISCPSDATPEMDAAAYEATTRTVGKRIVPLAKARKMERDRDEWQLQALTKMALKQLACMWCGEIVHAPTGYEPGTPLSEEQRVQAYREHVATCPKHPVAPLREALKFIATDKIANDADMRYRAARALESLPMNDERTHGENND